MPGLLTGEKVRLRALEPEDADILYSWENDTELWGVSETLAPYSRESMREFIENQKHDIFITRQMRLVITLVGRDTPVGFIDLFDFDPVNLRAGVGVLVRPNFRRRGYAREALDLLCYYARTTLGVHSLWGSVATDNFPSRELFFGAKFVAIGTRLDWSRRGDGWKDEIFFQRFFSN